MTNLFYAVLMVFLCFVVLILMTVSHRANANKSAATTFQAACFSAFIWFFFSVFYFGFPDIDLAMTIQNYKFIGVALYPIFLYLQIRNLIGLKAFKKPILALLFAVPFLTLLAVITDPWLHLMIGHYVFSGVFPERVLLYLSYGPWFYVHLVYAYLFAIPTFLMLFRMFYLSPRRFRRPIYLLFAAALVTICANFVVLFDVVRFEFDITVFAVVITLFLCFQALTIMKSANILMVSREHIYDNISVMILILDANKIILDCNKKASALFESLSLKPYGCAYDTLIKTWSKKYNGRISPYDPNILTTTDGSKESHNKIVLQEVIVHEQHLGYMVMVQEITQLYMLFRYLEDSAMFDPLTGLYNRNVYNEKLVSLKNKQSLPLGIIIGDVNNLKYVNDTFGHLIGDKLLREVAEILKAAAPENAFVIRFGGDEFSIIIPATTQAACDAVIDEINQKCTACSNRYYGAPSIALGNALVTDLSQEIEQAIKEADEKMYQNKYDRRKKNPRPAENT